MLKFSGLSCIAEVAHRYGYTNTLGRSHVQGLVSRLWKRDVTVAFGMAQLILHALRYDSETISKRADSRAGCLHTLLYIWRSRSYL